MAYLIDEIKKLELEKLEYRICNANIAFNIFMITVIEGKSHIASMIAAITAKFSIFDLR